MTIHALPSSRSPFDALPPGPELDERRQTLEWFSRPYAMLDKCAERFGDRFTLRVSGWGTQVVVADPAAIRDVFLAPGDVLHGGEANGFLRPLFGSHSLLLLDGPTHRVERRRLLPAFHGERLRAYGTLMQGIVRSASEDWPEATPFSMAEAMLGVSLEIILRAVFGVSDDARYHAIRDLVATLLRLTSTSVIATETTTNGSPLKRVQRDLDDRLLEECERRRARGGRRDDLLQILLDSRHEDGTPPSDDELRDQILTILVAGHETTAITLVWALLLLAEHPPVLTRLRDEVAALGARRDPDAVARLPYLQAVVNETLRVRPVVPAISRRVAKPVRIGGMELDAGVNVAPCPYLAHRRAARFAAPDQFRPDRFLEDPPGPNEYLPFGGGVRRCIGMGFAVHEMKLVLAELVSAFEFESDASAPMRSVRKMVVVAPSEAGRMRIRRRSQNPGAHVP